MLNVLSRIERNRKLIEKWAPPQPIDIGPVLEAAIAQMPGWSSPLFEPSRYKAMYGGRGGGKSVTVADALLILAARTPLRILCCREFQNSIRDSSHYLLAERIDDLGLSAVFDVQRDRIVGVNGSEFLFKGVYRNISSIKSMASIDICWVEEAQTISAKSWRVLTPTIRADNSEIWVTFNPSEEEDVVYQTFVANPADNAFIVEVNHRDNPHFPAVLETERLELLASDPDAYAHVWEGKLWTRSDAQIMRGKWRVEYFEPGEDWGEPLQGADFGFSKDPTTLSRSWAYNGCLYIEYESYQVGLELDHTARRWELDVPGFSAYPVRGDSARPETISYLRRHGVPHITRSLKGKGSVADGITYLRQFTEIIIHPRCTHTADEMRLYRYKVDERTDKVLPIPVDAHNHLIDGLRYALEPLQRAWAEKRAESALPKRRSRWRG